VITVRRAGSLDARDMAELLAAIVRKGGTTAYQRLVPRDTILQWMQRDPDRSAWHVAEEDSGQILGFQFVEPHRDLPPEACDIASFVRLGQTGLGTGSKLFEASRQAAKELGYRWINGTIHADNEDGLAYYQSRGFEDHATHPDREPGAGHRGHKISKRYDPTQAGPDPGLPRRPLCQYPLQCSAVHVQAARGFGHVAIAKFVNALDMLPPHAIRAHRVFRWRRQVLALREQGVGDIRRVGRFGQVIVCPDLDRRHRSGNCAVAC